MAVDARFPGAAHIRRLDTPQRVQALGRCRFWGSRFDCGASYTRHHWLKADELHSTALGRCSINQGGTPCVLLSLHLADHDNGGS